MIKIIATLAVAAFTAACGGSSALDAGEGSGFTGPAGAKPIKLAACGSSTTPFTVVPVPFADLLGWVPLGNLNPPGHLFPTDHQYLYVNHPGFPSTVRQVKVLSPGTITVTRAHRTVYSASNTSDYSLEFGACDEVRGEFGHVTSVEPPLLAKLGAFDQECGTQSPGFASCWTKSVTIAVAAGETIGTTGGQGTSFALDFSLFDSRVPPIAFANPARWLRNENGIDRFHTVAASDYFAEPARSMIRAKLGMFDGSVIRTTEPAGGTIANDRTGTAQGVWLNPAQATFPESPHLAIVPDPVEPFRMTISMGTSQPGVSAGVYRFLPATSGFVNRHPAQITPDGSIYCFEFAGLQGLLIVRLDDATTLRVEGLPVNTTCTAQQPWAFGANAFVYKR